MTRFLILLAVAAGCLACAFSLRPVPALPVSEEEWAMLWVAG